MQMKFRTHQIPLFTYSIIIQILGSCIDESSRRYFSRELAQDKAYVHLVSKHTVSINSVRSEQSHHSQEDREKREGKKKNSYTLWYLQDCLIQLLRR